MSRRVDLPAAEGPLRKDRGEPALALADLIDLDPIGA